MLNPYVPRPIDEPTAVDLADDADLSLLDEAKVFAAPDDPEQWPAWRERLGRWRAEARHRLSYDGSRYASETDPSLVVAMVWLWDELLYDHVAERFTVGRYVDHAEHEFGGLDAVLLWHAYPIEGIDDRDQFAFYRGVHELPAVVTDLHERGLRVLAVVHPWESPETDAVVDLVAWSGADGVFLDSAKEGSHAIRAALDGLRDGLVLEGESRLPLARVHDHSLSWAQWFADSDVPGVLRGKWFERRHVLHHTRRWHRSHLDELHSAWLNGTGILIWECVFGVWVGWSERDRSVLRTMRRVHAGYARWLLSESWTPLADHPGGRIAVHASRWLHDDVPLWTVVNRGDDYEGPWLRTDAWPDRIWTELTAGVELNVSVVDGTTVVGGRVPAGGIAAVVATEDAVDVPAAHEISDDASFPARAAVRVAERYAPSRRTTVPDGFAVVPPGRQQLLVRHRVRETGLYGEAPFVDEWKPLPPRLHNTGTLLRDVELGPFAVSGLEVSNAEYADFLTASGYQPRRPERFAACIGAGPPDQPVTCVDLTDARAYAHWHRLRLPTEDEWQVAAVAGLLQRRTPTVWNLTESEHTDGRTRFCILKGGSDFHNHASDWFFDGGPREPEWSAKLLLAGAGVGRSSSVGFRCAATLPDDPREVAS